MQTADPNDAFRVIEGDEGCPFLLVCDHASNHIPQRYDRLGLQADDMERHIAYDIGASELTERLAETLCATAVLGRYSRLLIDVNRPFDTIQSIPETSEATVIPGNSGLSEAEIELRRNTIFQPFHDALSRMIDGRIESGQSTIVIAVHSFTSIFLGKTRPWDAGVLYEKPSAVARTLIHFLENLPGVVVGDNEPYGLDRRGDYTIPVHALDRDLSGVLVEVCNRHLLNTDDIRWWSDTLASALRTISQINDGSGQ